MPTIAPTATDARPMPLPIEVSSPRAAPKTRNAVAAPATSGAANATGSMPAEHSVGEEDVRGVDRRRREREHDPERVGHAGASAHERDADEHSGERGDTPDAETLATESGRRADDEQQVRVVQEHRERGRGPAERRVEERRVGRVQDDAERERRTRDAQRQGPQALARDHGEDDGGDGVAPAEQRGDGRSGVERQLPEDGLDRERDAGAEAERDAETIGVTSDHEARLRLVQR